MPEMEEATVVQEKLASLGQIATIIAHEIRNPLSGLNIYLSSLEFILAGRGPIDDAAREQAKGIVQTMRGVSDKIEGIVQGVLKLSRPVPVSLGPMQINRAVLDVVPLCQGVLRKGRIRLETKLAEKSPECGADPILVELVLLNLVNNAAQALETVKRKKTIAIATRLVDAHGVISVDDSGPGVPSELRERIFDPVFTTKKDGLGIGLGFCRRVAALHSGFLEVCESPLGGAAFRFGIPLACGKAAAPPELAI